VFKTLYLKVAENEIEKVRKKDTFPAIRYILILLSCCSALGRHPAPRVSIKSLTLKSLML
jgi:hypothetical protein